MARLKRNTKEKMILCARELLSWNGKPPYALSLSFQETSGIPILTSTIRGDPSPASTKGFASNVRLGLECGMPAIGRSIA